MTAGNLQLKSLFLVISTLKTVFSNSHNDWSYLNISGWNSQFSKCNGFEQSPIDIVNSYVFTLSENTGVILRNYNTFLDLDLMNNGKTVQLTSSSFKNLTLSTPVIANGNFTLDQVHFHWGATTESGSEHTIDGKSFAMEIHFVHFNSDKYSHFETAKHEVDGVVVLSVLVETPANVKSSNKVWNNIRDGITHLKKPNSRINMKAFSIQNLLPSNIQDFYFYRGSFTTPPCLESVSWIVFKERLRIYPEYVENFRTLQTLTHKSTLPLTANVRPVQLLYSRKVFKTFHSSQDTEQSLLFANGRIIGSHNVIVAVSYHSCQIPASITMSVLIPSLNVNWNKHNLISDTEERIVGAQPNYTVSLESHDHPRGKYNNTHHVTVKVTEENIAETATAINHHFVKCKRDLCVRAKIGDDSSCIRRVISLGENVLIKLTVKESCEKLYQLVVQSGNNTLLDQPITINQNVHMKKNSTAKNSLNISSFDWCFHLYVEETDRRIVKLFATISHFPEDVLVIEGSLLDSKKCDTIPHHVKLIVGIVIGVFIFLLALLTLYLCHRRYRQKSGGTNLLMNELENNINI